MDPSTLAVVGTNSMIEPIRRVVDSAIPTQASAEPPEYNQDLDLDVDRVVNASDLGKYAKPYPTYASLDNPLLGLTPQEFQSFKYVLNFLLHSMYIITVQFKLHGRPHKTSRASKYKCIICICKI